jgi:hypothetical protein
VVVNRMRASLGWSESDVAGTVRGFGSVAGLHFLPEDRAAVDRAMVAGRTLAEGGESALTRAFARLVDDLAPGTVAPTRRGLLSRRTTGRARRS